MRLGEVVKTGVMHDSASVDDIYEGFDAVPPSLDAGNIFSNQNIQTALKTASRGRRPTVSRDGDLHQTSFHSEM